MPRVVKIIETVRRWWLPGTGRGESGESLFNEHRISDVQDEKSLEEDGGDHCTAR